MTAFGDTLSSEEHAPASLADHARRAGQLNLSWADDRDTARKTVHRIGPNSAVPGQLTQDLPTWTHFEQATELVTDERELVPAPRERADA